MQSGRLAARCSCHSKTYDPELLQELTLETSNALSWGPVVCSAGCLCAPHLQRMPTWQACSQALQRPLTPGRHHRLAVASIFISSPQMHCLIWLTRRAGWHKVDHNTSHWSKPAAANGCSLMHQRCMQLQQSCYAPMQAAVSSAGDAWGKHLSHHSSVEALGRLQAESEGALVHPDYLPLFQGLWQRQQAAVQRADPTLLDASAARQEEARSQATPQLSAGAMSAAAQLVDAPSLHPHQLEAVNAMRGLWAGNTNALLAHEAGLGKTATAVVFSQCLRCVAGSCYRGADGGRQAEGRLFVSSHQIQLHLMSYQPTCLVHCSVRCAALQCCEMRVSG